MLEPPPAVSILPMAHLGTLPAATVELLSEMSVALVGGEQPVLVPSLLRHRPGAARAHLDGSASNHGRARHPPHSRGGEGTRAGGHASAAGGVAREAKRP